MTPIDTTPVKVLIVDDLDDNLVALEALLRRPDLQILQARSATEALELLLVNEVALALVDVQMPEIDGFELAELMRGSERTRGVPIIFVTTGSHEPQRVFAGYDAGAVDFLFKPIDTRILRHKVDTFVELYRVRRALSLQVEALSAREAEARRLRDELAETLRLNETFVAAVGHDLRNPLAAMMNAADLLMRSLEDPRPRGIAERLRTSGKRMALIIDDLYDLSRARLSGGLPIEPKPDIDFFAVVERVVTEQRVAWPKRTIELSCVGEGKGACDPGRLAQVVSNLVGNALRHGLPDAPVSVKVDGREATVVTLVVTNRGAIAPEVAQTLFQPFVANNATKARRDGLGLGLYIVKQIVLAHEGTVTVRGEDDSTVFEVKMPRVCATPAISSDPPAA